MTASTHSTFALTCGIVAISLQGCSANLYVKRIDPKQETAIVVRSENTPLRGQLDYYLPRTVITLNGTVALQSCSDTKSGATLTVNAVVSPEITTEPDPAYHYVIDLSQSRSWKKAVNVSVTSQSGYLQNFNGAISDQIGPDVTAAIGTLVQVGGAVAVALVGQPELVPLTSVAYNACATGKTCKKPPARFLPQVCRKSVLKALAKIKKLNAKLHAEGTFVPKDQTALEEKTRKLQAIQTDIASVQKQLTHSFSFRWTPCTSDLDNAKQSGNYYLVYQKVSLLPLLRAWVKLGDSTISSKEASKSHLPPPILLTLFIDSRSVGSPTPKDALIKGNSASIDFPGGLLLREPARAILRVCRETNDNESTCNETQTDVPTDKTVTDTTEDIGSRLTLELPQLGRMLVLPEHNGLFESDTLSVSLNADGTIGSLSDNSSSAAATGLTALGTAASNAQSAIAARATAISNLNTANQAVTTAQTTQMEAPDTYNKTLADCLTQATAVTAAGGTPVPCK